MRSVASFHVTIQHSMYPYLVVFKMLIKMKTTVLRLDNIYIHMIIHGKI